MTRPSSEPLTASRSLGPYSANFRPLLKAARDDGAIVDGFNLLLPFQHQAGECVDIEQPLPLLSVISVVQTTGQN